MYFETTCPHCGQHLRILSENASKPAKCGGCHQVFEPVNTAAASPTTEHRDTANPYAASPSDAHQPHYVPMAPHRGGLILAFGLLGWFLCPVIAWVMGRDDLRRIQNGQMDPNGRGLTQAGTILGMVQCIIFCVVLCGWMLIVIGAVVAGGVGAMH